MQQALNSIEVALATSRSLGSFWAIDNGLERYDLAKRELFVRPAPTPDVM